MESRRPCNPRMAAHELTIGFDADDTLWHNQPIFERSYDRFRELLARYHEPEIVSEILKKYPPEIQN